MIINTGKDARSKMLDYEQRIGVSREVMAKACQCSERLLDQVIECGMITHPNIAARIANKYKLNVGDYNELVHKDHRSVVLPKPKPLPKFRIWSDGTYYKNYIVNDTTGGQNED